MCQNFTVGTWNLRLPTAGGKVKEQTLEMKRYQWIVFELCEVSWKKIGETATLEGHEGTVSIGGRTITNLRLADDIDDLPGQDQELVNLIKHLEEVSTAYGMQISAEKTQLMTNNTNGISTDIAIDEKLVAVHSFKCLGTIVSDEV